MKSLFREHLECTMRDFTFFLRVLLGAVRLSLVRNDDLNVTLRTKSTRFEKRSLGTNTSHINISSGLDVIKSVSDDTQILKELISENILGSFMNLIKSGNNVILKIFVHLDGGSSSSLGFGLSQMLFSEQELSVQVGNFDNIRISEDNLASFKALLLVFITSTKANHSIVLQQFTTNGTSTNHKEGSVSNLLDHLVSHNQSKTIRSVFLFIKGKVFDSSFKFFLLFRDVGDNFAAVSVEELLSGHELLSDTLNGFLGNETSHESSQRSHSTLASE
mmetsp:Transcript_28558/g.25528  ORF Transcript_28558/g.25528 Transcript_28558/m.25528 type:complete len:275 (+) Transcript_28558:1672-2496(+)